MTDRDWNEFFQPQDFTQLLRAYVEFMTLGEAERALADECNILIREAISKAPEVFGQASPHGTVFRYRHPAFASDTHRARLVQIELLDKK